VLRPLQDVLVPDDYPDLLIGLGQPDDAAVYRIDEDRVLVATLDFFTPVVDDPYDYGAIAAANALSDLYAMGVDPLFALNISAMPPSLDLEIVGEIMRGGAEKVREADAVVAGGHSIQDDEPKYGMVAIGLGDEARLIKKVGAEPGDLLVLTKPLGTGVTTTALRAGEAEPVHVEEAVRWMSQLNRTASQVARAVGVNAGTDITGFGLLGHGIELSEASQVELRFYLDRIPFLSGAKQYADMWKFPGGSTDNRLYFQDRVEFEEGIEEVSQMMLFDAQTSGGLMLSLARDHLDDFMDQAGKNDLQFWIIGEVFEGSGIEVKRSADSSTLPGSSQIDRIWFHPESQA
jgi:selenide,water dikinase